MCVFKLVSASIDVITIHMHCFFVLQAVSINNRRIANGFPPLVGSGGWNPLGSIYKEDVTMNETK